MSTVHCKDIGGLTVKSVTIPALILASINAKNLWDEHWEHEKHKPPLEERVQYPYQNIRTKAYFWGNGDKVSGWITTKTLKGFKLITLRFGRPCCK